MTLAASTVNCRLCTATWLLRTHCSFYARDAEDAGENRHDEDNSSSHYFRTSTAYVPLLLKPRHSNIRIYLRT